MRVAVQVRTLPMNAAAPIISVQLKIKEEERKKKKTNNKIK